MRATYTRRLDQSEVVPSEPAERVRWLERHGGRPRGVLVDVTATADLAAWMAAGVEITTEGATRPGSGSYELHHAIDEAAVRIGRETGALPAELPAPIVAEILAAEAHRLVEDRERRATTERERYARAEVETRERAAREARQEAARLEKARREPLERAALVERYVAAHPTEAARAAEGLVDRAEAVQAVQASLFGALAEAHPARETWTDSRTREACGCQCGEGSGTVRHEAHDGPPESLSAEGYATLQAVRDAAATIPGAEVSLRTRTHWIEDCDCDCGAVEEATALVRLRLEDCAVTLTHEVTLELA